MEAPVNISFITDQSYQRKFNNSNDKQTVLSWTFCNQVFFIPVLLLTILFLIIFLPYFPSRKIGIIKIDGYLGVHIYVLSEVDWFDGGKKKDNVD